MDFIFKSSVILTSGGILSRAPIRGGLHGTAVPDSKKKPHMMITVVFPSTFCEAEWNDPQNRSNSLKSIGFMCKSDHGVWHSFQIRCHFSLILIGKLSIWGWNVKLPKSVIVSKSIGNMYKTNTPYLWAFWCHCHFWLLFLVFYCRFWLNSLVNS